MATPEYLEVTVASKEAIGSVTNQLLVEIELEFPISNVTVKCSRSLSFVDPLDEEDITWFLQGYIKDPFSAARALQAESTIRQLEERLWTELDLQSALDGTSLSLPKTAVVLNVISVGPVNLIDRMPWELLEFANPQKSGTAFLVRRVMNRTRQASIIPTRTFNILLVVSRSPDRPDIEQNHIAKPMFDIIQELPNTKIWMDIVRPGTYDAFERSLKGSRKYDLVHFDLHGTISNELSGSV